MRDRIESATAIALRRITTRRLTWDEIRNFLHDLKAQGIAVVGLPDLDGIKLQHISFGPDAECEHECCPAWIEDDDTEVSYSLDEARDLAAALLAAADAAEVST